MIHLKRAFEKYLTKQDVNKLIINNIYRQQQLKKRVIVTIGGDQLTGKSSLAKKIIQLPSIHNKFKHTNVWSTGKTMRVLASEQNLTIGEFSNALASSETNLEQNNIDISIDYKTCSLIMNNESNNNKDDIEELELFILEGRQPAVMASFCQYLNENSITMPIFRIYLTCSIKEQAIRFFQREIQDENTIKTVKKILLQEEEDADDEENLMRIANKLLDNKDLFHNDHKDSIMKFYDNAKRDENDRNRFYKLYTKENYYKNLNFYDCIIDTTNIIEKEKIKLCKDSFENWLFQNEYM